MGVQVEFAASGRQTPFSAEVIGTDADGALLVAMDTATLARAVERAAFHLQPGVVGVIGSLNRPAGRTARVRLRGAGARPPLNLDAAGTAAWLAATPDGTDAANWLITDWTVAGVRHRTAWDYLAADPTSGQDPVVGALQFVLDAHPTLPDELADAGRLLAALTPPRGSVLDEVAAVLGSLGVRSDRLPDQGPLGFTMHGEATDAGTDSWSCLADELPDSWLVIYAELPVAVLETDLAAARAVVARINGELQIGSLLIDPTGETVMYRAATGLDPAYGRPAAIGRLLEVVLKNTQAALAQWRWASTPADDD